MDKFTDSRGRPWPGRGPRRARAIAVGVLLAALGAVLRFALTVGTPRGLHVHDVGVILMLAGVVGLVLPGSSGGGLRSVWLRTRWISPAEPRGYGEAPAGADPGVSLDAPALQEDDL